MQEKLEASDQTRSNNINGKVQPDNEIPAESKGNVYRKSKPKHVAT